MEEVKCYSGVQWLLWLAEVKAFGCDLEGGVVGHGVTGGVEVGGGSQGACESGKDDGEGCWLGCYGLVLV